MNRILAVHGTDIGSATDIQKKGFELPNKNSDDLMYGDAVYFFCHTRDGIDAACGWVRRNAKANSLDGIVTLVAPITYEDHDCLPWTDEFETMVNERAKAMDSELAWRTRKNILRAQIVTELEAELQSEIKILKTKFPVDYLHSSLKTVDGYVVYKTELIDKPPYKEVSCNGY